MEMAGEIKNDGGGFSAIAFGCRVFDSVFNGYGTYKFGPTGTGLVNNNFGNIMWRRSNAVSGTLRGWVFGAALVTKPLVFSYPVTFGVDVTNPIFQPASTFQIAGVNSDCPNGFSSSNWYDIHNNIYCSWTSNNVQQYMSWDGYSTVLQIGNTVCQFSTAKEFICMVPYGALFNYVWCENAISGVKTLLVTDFIAAVFNQAPVLGAAPGSTIDLNAFINDPVTPSPTACYGGWLWMNQTTQTIDGQTLTGFGIYVAPDFSTYKILKIIPADAYASNWNTGVGTVLGKFDDQGALFLNNVNSDTDIFASTPISDYIYPLFPPVKIPTPPRDGDPYMQQYRGG